MKDVRFGGDSLIVDLVDGPTITVPLAWYPRLLRATPEQRANWSLCGGGYGIHWPDLDEDLSIEGLLLETEAGSGTLRGVEAETARWFAEEKHADHAEAWRQEIERRTVELDKGVVEPVSWEEVQEHVFGRPPGKRR